MKKTILVLTCLMFIVLSACGQADNTVGNLATQNEEIITITAAESVESNTSEEAEETIESSISLEETIKDFQPLASTGAFEYDAINDCMIIDGYIYDVASDEMDCHAGYMFYYMVNGAMEDIRDFINNNASEKDYWREMYTDEMREKIKNLKENGGKILNYYILNAPGFVHGPRWAEVPVVVEYSYEEETYHVILVFYPLHRIVEEGVDIVYEITEVEYREAMNGWGLEE